MRPILIIVLVALVALLAAFGLGLIDIDQTKSGKLPEIKAQGGQLPGFDVKTGKVEVTTTNKTVDVPKVTTEKETVEVPTMEVEQAK